MAKINHYITMLLFSVMFLAGLQVPAFVDQYTKRVDAQLVEVSRLLSQYQKIANKYHNGSMQELIELHEASHNPTFNDEASVIMQHVMRQQYLSTHYQQLTKNMFSATSTMILHADHDIYERTLAQFSMGVQFTKLSLLFATLLAILSCVIYELFQFSMKRLAKRVVRKAKQRKQPA